MINKAEVVARGIQEYVNKARRKTPIKLISTQMREIYGIKSFDRGLYHSISYENMMKFLKVTRLDYRNTLNVENRKKIAQNELKLWKDYINLRKNELSDEFKITNDMIGHMEETWNTIKTRGEAKMSPSKILDFHYEYTKAFKFEVPLEARCLVQLIHPSMGYLNHLPEAISFQELLEIYNIKLVASYEKSLGQTLLGQEISALAYWNLVDKNANGFMDLKAFVDFLKIFRIALSHNKSSFLQEFNFGLQLHHGECSKDISESEDIVRFDFFRYIFLERNL